MNRNLIFILALVLFAGSAFAVHTTTVLFPSDSNNLTGTVGIKFNITDGNFVAATYDVNVTIAVSTSAGAFTTYLVRDVNANAYCGAAANYADVNCTYTFDTTTVADGNYFVDINAITLLTTIDSNSMTNDWNSTIDSSNSSFSIDNSGPTISSPSPSGFVDPSVTMSVITNESATCRYDSLDVAYASMGAGTTSGLGTSHSWNLTFTAAEGLKTFYIRCINTPGVTSTGTTISFTVRSAGGSGGSFCGDNICDSSESAATCAADCPAVCGDGTCTGTESKNTCPADCGVGVICGDNTCGQGENFNICPSDCEAPIGQKVRETVLSREMKGKPTPDDIARILEAAGASENAVEKARAALSETNVQRNIEVVKETENGKTTFTTIIELVVQNNSWKDLENVTVIEEIPKQVLENANNVKSAVEFTILNSDPIIAFEFGSMNAGDTSSVKYSIDKQVSESDIELFAPAFVSGFAEIQNSLTCSELNCDDYNPCTVDSCENSRCFNVPKQNGESCGTGMVCRSGECVESSSVTVVEPPQDNTLLIIIGGIIIVAVLAYFFYSKK
ncbi:MAG TPA: hypothetical protein VFF13_06330 [archaeon]|nr:hypothetical protein [archaeon]